MFGTVRQGGSDTSLVFSVKEVLVGTATSEVFRISTPAEKRFDYFLQVVDMLGSTQNNSAVLFALTPPAAEFTGRAGALYSAGGWMGLQRPGGAWEFCDCVSWTLGTWFGSVEALAAQIRYLLAMGTNAVVAAEKAGFGFERCVPVAKWKGTASSLTAVWIGRGTVPCLYLQTDREDRLLRVTMRDGHNRIKSFDTISTFPPSAGSCWMDVNGDGLLDRFSVENGLLRISTQTASGRFRKMRLMGDVEIREECFGLEGVASTEGTVGMLVSCSTPHVLLVDRAGVVVRKELCGREISAKCVNRCTVADFNSDGVIDVLVPTTNGFLFCAGHPEGGFASGRRSDVAYAVTNFAMAMGDFDNDGYLDVIGNDGKRLLLGRNMRNGTFAGMRVDIWADLFSEYELACIAVGDYNNDGFPDLVTTDAATLSNWCFGRGLLTFGYEGWYPQEIWLEFEKRISEMTRIYQLRHVSLADVNGDGRQDVLLLSKDGRTGGCVEIGNRGVDSPLSAAVFVDRDAGVSAPVKVDAWVGSHALGARLVSPSAPAFFGIPRAGRVRFRWQFPGTSPQEGCLDVVQNPVQVFLKRSGLISTGISPR